MGPVDEGERHIYTVADGRPGHTATPVTASLRPAHCCDLSGRKNKKVSCLGLHYVQWRAVLGTGGTPMVSRATGRAGPLRGSPAVCAPPGRQGRPVAPQELPGIYWIFDGPGNVISGVRHSDETRASCSSARAARAPTRRARMLIRMSMVARGSSPNSADAALTIRNRCPFAVSRSNHASHKSRTLVDDRCRHEDLALLPQAPRGDREAAEQYDVETGPENLPVGGDVGAGQGHGKPDCPGNQGETASSQEPAHSGWSPSADGSGSGVTRELPARCGSDELVVPQSLDEHLVSVLAARAT